MQKEILLYGGTFDPPTTAHVSMAKSAFTYCEGRTGATELWFLPCFSDTFGVKKPETPKHRVAMLELLLEHNVRDPRFSVCTHDIGMANQAGTYAVVRSLIKAYPGVHFRYVIGMDQAVNIRSWRNSRDLLKTIPFIVTRRLKSPYYGNIWWYNQKPHMLLPKDNFTSPVSSSQVRSDYTNSSKRKHYMENTHPMLNLHVQHYINTRGPYKPEEQHVAQFTDNF